MAATATTTAAAPCRSHSSTDSSGAGDDSPVCWICLSEEGTLTRPCTCPRHSHAACLARWTLQMAGRSESTHCRFCNGSLPDWSLAYQELPRALPIMTVIYKGETHSIAVHPGKEGETQFVDTIRRIYGLSRNDEVSLTFGCKVPSVGAGFGGGDITLEGSSSFSAAVELASISAGERMRRQQEQQEQQQQLGAAAGAATAGVTGEARQSGGGVLGSAMRRLFR